MTREYPPSQHKTTTFRGDFKVARRFWTSEEDRVLRRLYPHHDTEWVAGQLDRSVAAIYGRVDIHGIHKTTAYLAIAVARVSANLMEGGKVSRFAKGQVPQNKGLRRPGWGPGRMKQTQFRKGQKSCNWMPVGSERVTKDGTLQRKMTDTGYPPGDWKSIHSLVWVEHNGPLPPGHIVRFKDQNNRNFDPANLELVSRAENMRRNSVHRLPKELAQVVQLRGALMRRINRRTRNEKQD